MDAELYRKVQEILNQAFAVPPEEREAFVEEACREDQAVRAEVRELLRQDAEGASFMDRVAEGAVAKEMLAEVVRGEWDSGSPNPTLHSSGTSPLPPEIDGYRIVRRLGTGGMGIVYEARQNVPNRTVALKVMRPELETPEGVHRFRREAEVLGRLSHPGIAHIYGAGLIREDAEGVGPRRPYFVMEFVEGSRLDDWIRDRGLGWRQRLELVARVCDAIQHAHEHGVVHRDLKPGNILVTESGDPKILDFGVARAVDGDGGGGSSFETRAGSLLGTLAYMSPEQVQENPDEVDCRSDVYALGAILFESLSGRLPHDLTDRSLPEAARVIRDEEPARLGTLSTRFRGDVETLVGKALEKDRERRYGSAADLAADLRRYLRDQPIVARPPSTLYQLRKFARRNRALVSALLSVFLVLVAGFVTSTLLYFQAEEGRVREVGLKVEARESQAEAERSAERAEAINAYLSRVLVRANPDEHPSGREMRVWELLDGASEDLSTAFEGQPEVEAEVLLILGEAYRVRGRLPEAREKLSRSLELRGSIFGDQSVEKAEVLLALGRTLTRVGNLAEAEDLLREGQDILGAVASRDEAFSLEFLRALGIAKDRAGEFGEAEEILRELVKRRRASFGNVNSELATDLSNLAGVLWERSQFGESERLYRESLRIARSLYPEPHATTARCLNNLAVQLRTRGRIDEAEPMYQEALEIFLKVYGEVHPAVSATLGNLAIIHRERGEFDRAIELLGRALDLSFEIFGDRHPEIAGLLHTLGMLHKDRGDLEEAEERMTAALRMRREIGGDESTDVSDSLMGLAGLFWRRREFDQAEAYSREALGIRRQSYGDGYAVAVTLGDLGSLLLDARKPEEAEPVLASGVAMLEAVDQDHDGATVHLLYQYARVLMMGMKYGDAEPVATAGYEAAAGLPGQDEIARRCAQMMVVVCGEAGRDEEKRVWRERGRGGR